MRDYIAKYSNWGRWGEEDQLGALNHVGPEQIKAAAGLVRQGKVVSMSLPYDLFGPQVGAFRANPLNMMTATGTDYLTGHQDPLPADWGQAYTFGFADDVIVMPNQSGTQWDSLGHIFFEGKMYNGFDAGLVSSRGAERCSIVATRERFIMRGVLLDVAKHKGVDALEPGYAVTPADLDACASAQSVDVRSGDCVILRTGMLGQRRGKWGDYCGGPAPGLVAAHGALAGRTRGGGHRHRHVGLRGAAQRDRALPAPPHRRPRPHGDPLRGDLGPRADQRRLRRRRRLRVPAVGGTAADHRRRRFTAQRPGHQIGSDSVDWSLTADQRRWRDTARAYATEVVAPAAPLLDAEADPEKSFSWALVDSASEYGLRLAPLPGRLRRRRAPTSSPTP